MYHVLIAEDEMLVRIGIKNSIKWPDYGMKVIDDVSDGLQAWDSYEKYKPDIIITDLKMPQMDGMEFISRVRSKDKRTRIVILSCIEDFKLAQEAMVYGVSGYILKLTMTWDEMDKILLKVVEELELQYETATNANNGYQDIGLLKAQSLSECFLQHDFYANSFEEFVMKSKLRLKPINLILCLVGMDDIIPFDNSSQADNKLSIDKSIINLISEILDGYDIGEIIYFNEKSYALLFSFSEYNNREEIRDRLDKTLDHIKRLMHKYFHISVTFAISSIKDGYDSLKRLYDECLEAFNSKFYIGKGSYLYFENSIEDRFNIYVKPLLDKVAVSCVEFFGDDCKDEFEEAVSQFGMQVCQTEADVRKIFLLCLQIPLTAMKIVRQDIFLVQVSYADKIQEVKTIDELYQLYNQYLIEISKIIGRRTGLSREMNLALQYIRENYHKNISLQQVANHVNLSTNYLCTIFRNEMQVNFVEYLSHYRLEKAKELLLNSGLKLYEISEKVGFSDVGYFCRIFKGITGCRPNEFRRKFSQNGFL